MENKNINIQNKIFSYLNEKMGEGERIAFEKAMDKDKSLSDELMKVISKNYEKARIKQIIKADSDTDNNAIVFPPDKRWLQVAAVLLILLSSALVVYLLLGKPEKSLITENNMLYPSAYSFRGGPDVVKNPVQKADMLYRDKEYVKAAVLFEQVADTTNINTAMFLYAGISRLWCKGGNSKEIAIAHFQKVLSNENNYNEAARWFLAITFYETGNKGEAKKLFEQIADSKRHFHKKEAKKILLEFGF